jgi:hypothetical protein
MNVIAISAQTRMDTGIPQLMPPTLLTRRLVTLGKYNSEQLNIAEIELAVLSNSCLSRRIPEEPTLRRKVDGNVLDRNAKAIPVKWKFTAQEARRKLARLYRRSGLVVSLQATRSH